MTRVQGDKTTWPRVRADWTQGGDVEAICSECGYSEEWRTRPRPPRRCPMCGSRAVRLEWQPPGSGPKEVIYRENPDGAAKETLAKEVAREPVFVWSLMGRQDAGLPLEKIIIRKEAERRTGGEFWWGLGTALGPGVESEAIRNRGTLPALLCEALSNQKEAPNQNIYVWNRWISVRKGRYGLRSSGSIPKHVLVLGGNPDKGYYGLVCRCESELVLGDHGPFDPAQCRTVAKGLLPDSRQRAALLTGQIKHWHGPYRIAFNAHLVEPWFVRLTKPRVLTAAELARVRQYNPGDDWLSLVKSLRP
jgi:hypothetical protein